MDNEIYGLRDEIDILQSELDTYKIALKYFTDQSKANSDIAANLLRELEG